MTSRTTRGTRGFTAPARCPSSSAGRRSRGTSTRWPSPGRTSRELLADLLGEPCTTAAVPGGDISRLVLDSAAAAGFHQVFTCEPTLVPERVGASWVLGRFSVKVTTSASRIRELAGLRGWERALLVRRLKNFARMALPGPYRQYVRWRTT